MKNFRTCLFTVLFLCLVFSAYPCYAHDNGGSTKKHSFTKHFRETFFSITEKAEFSIEVLPDEKEYKIGRNVVGIVIHNKHDEDVEGAELTVTAEGMAKEINEPITVKEKGGGLYLASNLDLQRQGTWKLVIQVRSKSIADSAAFVFPASASKFLQPGKYSGNEKQ